MVPLERILRKPGSDAVAGFALPELKEPPNDPADPPRPRVFKVVDGVTRQVLADSVDPRGAVTALKDVRSFVDATIYVWEPKRERWRMLTLGETRALWDYRGRIEEAAPLR
jgi:hypothetical protein